MAQQVKLRRSSVPGAKPTTSQLELGELAINTNDGKIYFEKSSSLGESIQELITTDTWNTGSVNISGSLSITGSLRSNGLVYPTTDNGEFSFIQTDGLGNLTLQYVNTMYETVYNAETSSITKGTPLHISGSQGANPKAYFADANNPQRMPVFYIAGDNIASGNTGRGIILGSINGINTTGYPPGTEVYVAAGGGWTATRPTGSAIVQVLGIVTKEGAGGQGLVLNPGPANLPNLPSGSAWVGSISSYPTSIPTSSFLVNNAISASYASNGITNGNQYRIPVYSSSTGLTSSLFYQSGSYTTLRGETTPENPAAPDIFYVNGAGVDTFNLISAHGNLDDYVQVNVQNYNSGSGASSDIVATADNGDETVNYIDMGINGSNYTASTYVGAANDGYLYSSGNDLYIGNVTPAKRVIIFNGGYDAINNAKIFVHEQGTIGINTDQYDVVNPSSLIVQAPNSTTFNLITAKANVDNYSQFNITNLSSAASASSDIVATANNGTETTNYINIGINSSGHVVNNDFVGGPNDTYEISTGRNHYIGSMTTGSLILFTGQGANADGLSKIVLNSNNIHQMSGSFNVTGSITSSLHGTASWANNSISASYATTASYYGGSVTSASYAITASYALNAQSASYILNAISSSYALQALSASYATTSSYATFAQTASYVQNAQTASYVLQAISASYATTASYYGGIVISSSYATTASYVQNAQTASYVTLAQTASYVTLAQTASYYGGSVISASYAVTASHATVSQTASYAGAYLPLAGGTMNGTLQVGGQVLAFDQSGTRSWNVQASGGKLNFTSGDSLGTFDFGTNLNVNGTLTAASFTGSLQGTSSYATTASYALTAQTLLGSVVSASYAATASYVKLLAGPNITIDYYSDGIGITGSAGGSGTPGGVDGNIQYNNGSGFGGVPVLNYNGSILTGTGSFTGSFTGVLTGNASTSTSSSYATTASYANNGVTITNNTNNYLLTATGTSGVINGESGLTYNGDLNLEGSTALKINTTSTTKAAVITGITGATDFIDLDSVSRAIFIKYILKMDSLNFMRAGTIMVVSDALDGGSTINMTETTTNDIGSTAGVTMTASIIASRNIVTVTPVSGTWNLYYEYTYM